MFWRRRRLASSDIVLGLVFLQLASVLNNDVVAQSSVSQIGTETASQAQISVTQTKNFIDTVLGYKELSSCAESVLSTIVRDEHRGCQDTYAITSYSCFCTDSSSFMSGAISNGVVASCPASIRADQASSALGVFASYCALGVEADLATQTDQGKCMGERIRRRKLHLTDCSYSTVAGGGVSSSATPAGSVNSATATVTVTSTPTSAASSSGSSNSPSGTLIAVVVGVLVAVLGLTALIAMWFLLTRKHKKAVVALEAWPEGPRQRSSAWSKSGEGYGNSAGQGSQGLRSVVEVPTYERPGEMSATARRIEVLEGNGARLARTGLHAIPVELPASASESGPI